ncbi:MAG: 50S ribosomal protein L22 [Bdellovibrionales bacterium]
MEVKACLKYGRIGTLKAREVANLIRGRNVNEAFNILSYSGRKASGFMKKLLESALANAEQKKVIDVNNLYIKSIFVNQGPHLKRFRPSARSTSFPYKRKQSHINLVLSER